MVSLSSALSISTNGLRTSQVGLGTLSHNIANVNTEGFSRQEAQFSSVSLNGFGGGSELLSVLRRTDKFLEARVTDQNSISAQAQTRLDSLRSLESILGNPLRNTGIDDAITRFTTELTNLSNNPNSEPQKRNVVQQAQLLVDTMRGVNTDLANAQTRVEALLNEDIANVNTILQNINDLNLEIAKQSKNASGSNVNDLLDSRRQEINELSNYLGLQVTEDPNGPVRVLTETGRLLIDSGLYVQLERIPGTPFADIGIRKVLVDGSLAATPIDLETNDLTTGSIKALVDVRDTDIPNLLAQADELTNTIITEVNLIHSRGSSFPPLNSLTSGNVGSLTATTDDIYTGLNANLASDTMHISVVDSNGDTVFTTVNTGLAITGTGPITFPAAGPFSLDDLRDLINTNADIGVTALGAGLGITATTGTDASGDPFLQVTATDPNLRVVMHNANYSSTNDPLGVLGMNNFFTGTNTLDMAIRSDIASNPGRIATGRMRVGDDAGISSLSNSNITDLAQLSSRSVSFATAGGLAAGSDSLSGYASQILSNFALQIDNAADRSEFADQLKFELDEQRAAVSGVNLDEELAQMLIYQTSFQASARIISTVDNLLETLINSVR